jgi:pimeloyl-[acyl-carrier protein] methyl ester esterase
LSIYAQQIGHGPHVVLVHGWGLNSAAWHFLLPILSQRFTLTCIDVPGMGQSALTTPNYQLTEVCDALLAVAPPKAHWIGWSLGGMLALAIAARYPVRVNSLCLIASSPCLVQQDDWPGVSTAALAEFSKALLKDHQGLIQDFLQLHLRGAKDQAITQTLTEKILATGTPAVAALTGGLRLLNELDLRDSLQQLTVPSLHLFGRLDRLVPSAVANRVMQLNTLAKSLLFARSAHMPFVTEVDKFCQTVSEFFDESSRLSI